MKTLAAPFGALALLVPALPLAAEGPPPEAALPLSEIVAMVEAEHDVAWIEDIEWDDDGYWEMEHHSPGGETFELRVDPVATPLSARVSEGRDWPFSDDRPPPEGALPLSEVLARVEADNDIAWIEEVEWEDRGHWQIEYRGTDGRETETRIDPISGEPRG